MISYDEAVAIVREQAGQCRLNAETVPLSAIPSRIAAQDILAPLTVQPFDNSAMDGFAVRTVDLKGAQEGNPVILSSVEIIAAGTLAQTALQPGQCMEIMTGAPVPQGADAVVPVENVTVTDERVTFHACPQGGANIRRAGEDFRKGDPVVAAGQRLGEQHILPLATLGIGRLAVRRRARIGLITTGKEIIDDLAQGLAPGQIYNSNAPYAAAMLKAFGTEVIDYGSVPDEPEAFEGILERMLTDELDVVVSTGAVSAGKFDFVRQSIEGRGADILFHKVKIKPGKPNLFARFEGGPLYFGLPGNPAAVAAGLRFFVWPAIEAMSGLPVEEPESVALRATYSKKPGLLLFLKGRKADNGVAILEGQQSFQTNPFLSMNCWCIAGEQESVLAEGQDVRTFPVLPVP